MYTRCKRILWAGFRRRYVPVLDSRCLFASMHISLPAQLGLMPSNENQCSEPPPPLRSLAHSHSRSLSLCTHPDPRILCKPRTARPNRLLSHAQDHPIALHWAASDWIPRDGEGGGGKKTVEERGCIRQLCNSTVPSTSMVAMVTAGFSENA